MEYLRIEVPSDQKLRVVHVESYLGSLIHVGYVATNFFDVLGESYSEYLAAEWVLLRLVAVIDKEYAGKLSKYSVTAGRTTSIDHARIAASNMGYNVGDGSSEGVVASRSREFAPESIISTAPLLDGPKKSVAAETRPMPWLSIGLFGIIVLMNILPHLFGERGGSNRLEDRIDQLFLRLSDSKSCQCQPSSICLEGNQGNGPPKASTISNQTTIQVPKDTCQELRSHNSSPAKIIQVP